MTDWRDNCDWPRLLEESPKRPTYPVDDDWGLIDDEKYPEQVPHNFEIQASNDFAATGNIYFVIDLYLKFLDLGLYPPNWALQILAERFRKHLALPDPELLASQMGISGRVSGAINPYKEFSEWSGKFGYLTEIIILLGSFDIKFVEAIRAVREQEQLSISEKRIATIFRERFGDHRIFLARNRPQPYDDPLMLLDENGVEEYIKSFPRKFWKLLRSKRRAKT